MAFLNTYLPSHEATPSLAELERYVQGKMTKEEQAHFEISLAEDPMLADAVRDYNISRTLHHSDVDQATTASQ